MTWATRLYHNMGYTRVTCGVRLYLPSEYTPCPFNHIQIIMNTYSSILEVTPEIASTMKKSEVRKIATDEIDAIDNRFEAEGKGVGVAGTAKNTLTSEVKGTALGCLNLLLPFAALGHFKMGRKKTAITQIVLCCLSLIIISANFGMVGGVVGLYVVGFVYNTILKIWNRCVELKNSAKALVNIANPYIRTKELTFPEQFSAKQYYDEYIALLDEREAHYLQIIKLCR